MISVRAITAFIVLDKDPTAWDSKLDDAVACCSSLSAACVEAGYAVQSLRLITNPFGEYLDIRSADFALIGIKLLRQKLLALEVSVGIRMRFSIGAARNAEELKIIPALIKEAGDLANCCINIPMSKDNVLDFELVSAAAEVCSTLGRETVRGEGNFNFTINFNGPHLCPYFPAGYNTRELGESFVIGLEYPDLLVHLLKGMIPDCCGGKSIVASPATRGADWAAAANVIKSALEQHVAVLAALAETASVTSGRVFGGIDTSPAPSKNVHSMCEVIELLGVDHFGGCGTVEACAFLTRIFKSIRGAPLVGFSGLMFACLEDKGLAEAALRNQYDIRALLTYSAVCGIGLDTVPIPGDSTVEQIIGLACDCGTLAFRLNKPLSVRLFPVPGLSAGDVTSFESDDLCNCRVFDIP